MPKSVPTLLSKKEVNEAIDTMERRLNQLVGELPEPDLQCFTDGKNIDNAVLDVVQGEECPFGLQNMGDVSATNVRIRLYIVAERQVEVHPSPEGDWFGIDSQERDYPKAFRFVPASGRIDLAPNQSLPLGSIASSEKPQTRIPAMFKLYYGRHEREIRFTMNITL